MFGLDVKNWAFIAGLLLSVAVFAVGLFFSIKKRDVIKRKVGVTPWQTLIVVTIAAAVFVYLPIYYFGTELGGGVNVIRPLLMSAFQVVRLFIIDGDLAVVIDALDGVKVGISAPFVLWAVSFFAFCPILTANLILFVFRDFITQIKFGLTKGKSIYIMSELNESSVAMAQSIQSSEALQSKEKLIVFANAGKTDDERKQQLLDAAHELKAICLKQDVSDIDLPLNGNVFELFLLSEDEADNVEKCVALSDKWRNKIVFENKKTLSATADASCTKNKVKVFVYASSAADGHIIDSLDKDILTISDDVRKKLEKDERIIEDVYKSGIKVIDGLNIENDFDIRRIDCAADFAMDTLEKSHIFELCKMNAAKKDGKIISILIAGVGKFGKEILKNAIWYCQAPGYKLEINVIDYGMNKQGVKTDVKEILRHEWPEIIDKPQPDADGEEGYDIKFFDANCFDSSLDKLFKAQKERLLKTQVVFVTLGSDDKNIDVALEIRRQFDRIIELHDNKATLKKLQSSEFNDLPLINAVVYDEKKAKNMAKMLINHKEVPYHINFIGSLKDIYNYGNIARNEQNEADAFKFHVEWVENEKKLQSALKTCQDPEILKKICEGRGVDSVDEIEFGSHTVDDLLNEIGKYYRFEYYRNSSVSKAIHKNMLNKEFKDDIKCTSNDKNFLCTCENCQRRRMVEHIRWSAYMRVNGFKFSEKRCDRGKVHPDLVKNEKLSFESQLKD